MLALYDSNSTLSPFFQQGYEFIDLVKTYRIVFPCVVWLLDVTRDFFMSFVAGSETIV